MCHCIPRDPRINMKKQKKKLCELGKLQLRLLEFRNKCMQMFLLVLLFSYSPLAAKTLQMWDCTEIGSTFYLVADFKITCDNMEWYFYAAWALLAAALYVLGIPLLIVTLVQRQRQRHVKEYLFQIYGTGHRKVMQRRTECSCVVCGWVGDSCVLVPFSPAEEPL